MATRSTSTRSRTTGTKRAPRRRASSTSPSTVQSLATDAKSAVRSARTRASRAARKVPTDRTSLSIAAGVIAGLVAAGVAIFMNRDRLRSAASTGGEKFRKAADDLTTMAHERIDQARDNITKFRLRASNGRGAENSTPATSDMAITG